MHILIASGIFHPESGGPATYLYQLLPDLLARGHRVTALSFGPGPVEGYGYPVIRVPRRGYWQRRKEYAARARQLWPGHDLAYVHSFNVPLPSILRPRVLKVVGDPAWERALNKGWVSPETDIIDTFRTRHPLVMLNKWLRLRYARQFDQIIVPSNYLRKLVSRWGIDEDRIQVIYNAVKPMTIAASKSEARQLLGLNDKPLLLIVARITAWKGIGHAIQALRQVPEVHLIIAGEGPMRQHYEFLAQEVGLSDRIVFVGNINRHELPLYYRAADFVLLYSSYEGLAHVLLEGLAVGTPAIVSDRGGNPETITHGVNGFVVPYNDIDRLAAIINQAIQALPFGVTLPERFQWERLVDQTEQALMAVAQRRS